MKKLFLLITIISLSLTSCSKDDSEIMEDSIEETIIENTYTVDGVETVLNKVVDGTYFFESELATLEAVIYNNTITLNITSTHDDLVDEVIEAPITNLIEDEFFGTHTYSLDYLANENGEIIIRQKTVKRFIYVWKLKKQ